MDLGYDYFISVDNLETCVNESLTNPDATMCAKFAGDHPDYSYGGTVNRNSYPKGCYVHTSNSLIMFNTHRDGSEEKDDVNVIFMLKQKKTISCSKNLLKPKFSQI